MSYIELLYGIHGMKRGVHKVYAKPDPKEAPNKDEQEPEHPIGPKATGPEKVGRTPAAPAPAEKSLLPASKVAQNKLYNSQDRQAEIKNKIAEAQAKMSKMTGKKNKAAREKLKAQLKDLHAKSKQEATIQKGLRQERSAAAKNERQTAAATKKAEREQARAAKKAQAAQVKTSKLAMKKAASVQNQAAKIASKIQNAELKAKLKEIANQAKASSDAHQAVITGIKQPAQAGLSEHWELSEKGKFVAWRSLTTQEQRVDWHSLNAYYNEQQIALKDDLTGAIGEDLDTNIKRVQNRLKAGDIAGIAAIALISANKLNSIINKYIKSAYEQGKNMASKELKVPKPITPTVKTQLMNLDSSMIAEQIATDIDLAAKQKARDGFAKDVATTAIVAAVVAAARKKAAQGISHVAGNVIGENLNKGSRLVYEKNTTVIQGFQRSEILDNRTCRMCEELDEEIVTADDPFAQLDQVHDYCRGRWVPIVLGEEFNPAEAGLPADITDSFDTIGGVPTVNAFTQLKKPLDDEGKAIADSIETKLGKKN